VAAVEPDGGGQSDDQNDGGDGLARRYTALGRLLLRSGGKLRDYLKPDVDQYTRRVEVGDDLTLRQILNVLETPEGLVAFAFADGKLRRLDYRPGDGDTVTLQPPVSGG